MTFIPSTTADSALQAQIKGVAEAQANEAKDTVKNAKKSVDSSTQMHLKIAEIHDNVAVLKNGGVRAVLKVSSINIHLKSEQEQNAIIYSYQGFLNTLDFPIQIVLRSKKLELDDYIDQLKSLAQKQTNPLLKDQTLDYIDYIQRLIEYADIMQKEFYVVIPYDPPRAKKITFLEKFVEYMTPKDSVAQLRQRHREFENLRKGLNQRINVAKSGLENCGLKVDQLTTEELITLFYECYNPRLSRLQKFKKSENIDVVHDNDLHESKEELEEG
ncbi:MAG: hypothetical protein UT36_C0003G0105 [Candidatus Peregrinibacteria bacterium GW2011_GWF2_39_17]|nr:MAG: hypothetical protein UT36_C0003G0105 [Candidatus Peregrinibacteria bacterium GW2011_GWF2_39_17]HCW31933.1 hypothetical protein [Candidatus Peregrinibacteria bacterium]